MCIRYIDDHGHRVDLQSIGDNLNGDSMENNNLDVTKFKCDDCCAESWISGGVSYCPACGSRKIRIVPAWFEGTSGYGSVHGKVTIE